MTGGALLLRFVLYGAATMVASAGDSWTLGLGLGAFTGLLGLGLERRLRAAFDSRPAILATLALLASGPANGISATPDPSQAVLFGASCLVFFVLAGSSIPSAPALGLAAAVSIGPAAFEWARASWWHIDPVNLLVALFGAHGTLYGAPLLWAGFLGLGGLRREKPALARLALAALGPGVVSLLLATDQAEASTRIATWLPFLLPGIAQCFQKAVAFARRRPERVVSGAAAVLVLWNLFLMEQYRLRLLPSDDTVSFAQVTSNSAGLLSRLFGTPAAWPANWIFAWRLEVPLDRWDAIAGRRLFANEKAVAATIEIGDDASLFAPDVPLLLEGFGARRTCEQGWCRDLDGAGRLLLPLAGVGRGDFTIRLRARGQGVLSLSLNGVSTSVAAMTESLSDVTLRAPARTANRGFNVLSLSVAGGGKATLDRLTLERDLGNGSAR